MIRFMVVAVVLTGVAANAPAQNAAKKPRPGTFAIIFNMGYAADALPKDKVAFGKLVASLKQAHYNVVLCKYDDQRATICKKNGIQIMADLLVSGQHVYKNPKEAAALCMRLRGNKDIWGYHLWSDRIGGTTAGRSRDVKNVHQWDPTHPTYVGSYNGRGLEGLTTADAIGYYDFHWRRGGHWRHLLRVLQAARKTDSYFLRYCQPDPGLIGKGNYNRVLYTISTSIAFGLKGYMYHYRNGTIEAKTGRWSALGKDLARVNAEIAPLGPELMLLGNPVAVYSTPITKTAKDRPTGQDMPTVPAELKPIPGDFRVQIKQGEAVMGVFQDMQKHDVLFFANHNAYQPQPMKLQLKKPVKKVELFNRKKKAWEELKVTEGTVQFSIPPAAGELVKVK